MAHIENARDTEEQTLPIGIECQIFLVIAASPLTSSALKYFLHVRDKGAALVLCNDLSSTAHAQSIGIRQEALIIM